jgi:outer membrane usher protein FimD/PapC
MVKNWRWAGHGQINLSATWQRVSGSRTSTQRDDDVFYIRLGLPLGHDRVNLSLRRQGSRTYNDVQTSGQWDDMSYSLSAGRDWQNAQYHQRQFWANLHYAQMSGYASQTANYWGYGGSLSGGISVNQEGILFSPYAIQESYGALSLNSPLSGIKVLPRRAPSGLIIAAKRWFPA